MNVQVPSVVTTMHDMTHVNEQYSEHCSAKNFVLTCEFLPCVLKVGFNG